MNTLRNIPEEWRYHLNRGRSLNWHINQICGGGGGALMEQTDIEELPMRFQVTATVLMKIKSCGVLCLVDWWIFTGISKGCFTHFCKTKQSIRVKLLEPEGEGTTLLRNFLYYSPVEAAQSPRRLESSSVKILPHRSVCLPALTFKNRASYI
jgi:hypothetical protein